VVRSVAGRQPGLGYGALRRPPLADVLCARLALRGWVEGDAFVASAIGASVALVALFTLYPISRLFVRALLDRDGNLLACGADERVARARIWGSAAWSRTRCSSGA
jgi:hypothetical protein